MGWSSPKEILQLVKDIELIKGFYGRSIDQMPIILSGKDSDGQVVDVPRKPVTSDRFIQLRIDVLNEYIKASAELADPKYIAALQAAIKKRWNTAVHTATLWVRHPEKGGKIVQYDGPGSKSHEVLQMFRPDSELVMSKYEEGLKVGGNEYCRGIVVPDGFYDALDGLELIPAEIEKMHCKPYPHGTIKDVEPWVALCRGKKQAANYDDAVHKLTYRSVDNSLGIRIVREGIPAYHISYMALHFGAATKDKVTATLWNISRGENDFSCAYSNTDLTNEYGCLIGEAQRTSIDDVVRKTDVARLLTKEFGVDPQNVEKYLERLAA